MKKKVRNPIMTIPFEDVVNRFLVGSSYTCIEDWLESLAETYALPSVKVLPSIFIGMHVKEELFKCAHYALAHAPFDACPQTCLFRLDYYIIEGFLDFVKNETIGLAVKSYARNDSSSKYLSTIWKGK